MNPETIFEYVMELAILPFFPSEPAARLAIASMIGKMAWREDQVRWLIDVATSGIWKKWEGPSELRAIFCMKFPPRDGIESSSAIFTEGLSLQQLNPGKRIELPSPRPLMLAGDCAPPAEDPEMAELVAKCTERVPSLPNVRVEITVLRDEDEVSALCRSIEIWNRDHRAIDHTRPATQEEIEEIKRVQEANRKERA